MPPQRKKKEEVDDDDEIVFSSDGDELESEEDLEDEEEEDLEDEDELDDDDDDEEEGSEDDDLAIAVSDAKPSNRSEKAEDRIQQLVRERNEALEKAKQLEEKTKELDDKVNQFGERLTQTQLYDYRQAITTLESRKKELRQQIRAARRDGQEDQEAQLEEELDDVNYRLRRGKEQLEQWEQAGQGKGARSESESKQTETKSDQPPQNQPNPHAKQWLQKNSSWFQKPGHEFATALAFNIDATLTKEGYNPQTPEYYRELSKRVKKQLGRQRSSGRKSTPVSDGSSAQRRSKTRKLRVPREAKAMAEGLGFADNPDMMKDFAKRLHNKEGA